MHMGLYPLHGHQRASDYHQGDTLQLGLRDVSRTAELMLLHVTLSRPTLNSISIEIQRA